MIVSLAACTLLSTAAYACDSDAAGIGYTWGQGELEYQNSSQRFSIKGVSVVDVGATNFSASGADRWGEIQPVGQRYARDAPAIVGLDGGFGLEVQSAFAPELAVRRPAPNDAWQSSPQ
jgi:hypothetical protein